MLPDGLGFPASSACKPPLKAATTTWKENTCYLYEGTWTSFYVYFEAVGQSDSGQLSTGTQTLTGWLSSIC